MNVYKILTFDGYSSKSYLVHGFDIIGAIQNNSMIMLTQIIKIELVESETHEDHTNTTRKCD